jgi:hypothetical protein
VLGDDGDEFDFTRVVDPSTVPEITNSPFAAGTVGVEFEFEVTADNAATVNATGLPGGLSFDAATRRISGTPSVGGQFPVAVTAVNTHGISAFGTLTVTIAIPTPVGQDVVVEPEAPEGQGPITLSFDEVTAGGTTTVTVLDPASLPPAGNPNVMFAGVVFDVSTTATFEGLVNLCFSYEGIVADGEPAPRLFHFENNVWVDITTSVDTVTKTVCGATTSLSPFALLVSDVVRAGFHAPVNPIAGFLNTVKGGSTVPLSFNVFVNGTEKTTTDGLELSQRPGGSRRGRAERRQRPELQQRLVPLQLEDAEDARPLLHGPHDDCTGRVGADRKVQDEVRDRCIRVPTVQPVLTGAHRRC